MQICSQLEKKMLYPEDAILLAPLAGFTDQAMRRSCARHGCRYSFAEMIDAGSLVYGNSKTFRLAERGADETFLGIQLVGSDPETLKKAVGIVNQGNYDVLDFNLGCPAPKVEKKCEGAAFPLKRPDEAVRMTALLVEHSKIPVTVKTRIISREEPELTINFLKRLESVGVSAITLHGRIAKEFYSGVPAREIIAAARSALSIPLIANGGIMCKADYDVMRKETGCSRVMLARGAMGNPWLFQELTDPGFRPPTVEELAEEIRIHVEDMLDWYGEEVGFRACRKVVLEYLRGRGYPGSLRATASFLNSRSGLMSLLDEIRKGPAEGFWTFLKNNPDSPRKLYNIAGDGSLSI